MLSRHMDPRPVAVARIGLGIAALINTLELYVVLSGIGAGKLAMPLVAWVPPVTETAALAFLALGTTAAVALVLGIGSSLAAAAYSLAACAVLLWEQQAYSSHQVLVVLLVAYLAFARSDTAWSVVRRPGPRQDVPWWPQLLMMTQLTACYLFAGLAKINDDFLSGEPLAEWIRWPLPEWVYAPMAVATVLTEVLVLAVGLWLPRVRLLAVAAGVGLHVSIVTMLTDNTLQLVTFAVACLALYPLFLTRPALRLGFVPAPEPEAASGVLAEQSRKAVKAT